MFLLPQGPRPPGTRWSLYAHHLGDYMHRWILRTPWGTLRLHHILRSDADRHLHDHPFDFTSFLLTGGYTEETPGKGEMRQVKWWPRFSVVRKKAEDLHKLILEKPLWTFVISGPKTRAWGFQTELGWINHKEYVEKFSEVVISRLGQAGYEAKLCEARRDV